ncbi:zinc-dependent peptidase [Marinoscillum sp. MHG1-6]|uniref:zinc-dependent peptidase n=1 Tax=Marinoscillum sp. MHG1-6 TaxID=2959627 RepID=UPI0021578D1C|nr:zinc-dependent peptidase [Marinoscillum sp. MHG1-6]
MAPVIALVFVLAGIIIFALVNFLQVFWSIFDYFLGDRRNTNWLIKPLRSEYKDIIQNKFSFYQQLGFRQRKTFEKRLQKFIDQKNFEPKGELKEVTPEMKALIGASAIQVTFGLPTIYLEHFTDIYIYPEPYFSNITGHYHKGEANSTGILVLTWDNFVKGYLDPNDGRNLGLHEMAHALKIEDYTRNSEFSFLDSKLISGFTRETRLEAIRINDGEPSIFRAYAATNDHEFFAVVIENFFERPEEFKVSNLRLYQLTCQLLNQDPLDYRAYLV